MTEMKKKIIILIITVLSLFLLTVLASSVSAEDSALTDEREDYQYNLEIMVNNFVTWKSYGKGRVNEFSFTFYYYSDNGYGTEEAYVLDMSRHGGSNSNSDILERYFIDDRDGEELQIDFPVTLPGVLKDVTVHINMDGGDRLGVEILRITCAGVQVNSNSDWASSAYNDSNAYVHSCMPMPYISPDYSPFFKSNQFMQREEFEELIGEREALGGYSSDFVDQYGIYFKNSSLRAAYRDDPHLNDFFDKQTMNIYKYTVDVHVNNPVNILDADKDAVEYFYLDFYYTADNGYGDVRLYTLDMSWNGHSNYNEEYLNLFRRTNDDEYDVSFDIYIPGLVGKVNILLNMSGGERMTLTFNRIMVNGFMLNTDTGKVSSSRLDSETYLSCDFQKGKIDTELNDPDRLLLFDQYRGILSDKMLFAAEGNLDGYIYHTDYVSQADKNATAAILKKILRTKKTVSDVLEDGETYAFIMSGSSLSFERKDVPDDSVPYIVTGKYPGSTCLELTAHYIQDYDAWYFAAASDNELSVNSPGGAGAAASEPVRLVRTNETDTSSLWKAERVGDYYRFTNVSNGMGMDVLNMSMTPGTELTVFPYWGGYNELFRLDKIR